MVRRDLLRTEGGAVMAAELDRSRAEFVSGGELARERGTSPRKLAADLAAAGVRPVTGPGVDGGRQTFFKRSHVASGPQGDRHVGSRPRAHTTRMAKEDG